MSLRSLLNRPIDTDFAYYNFKRDPAEKPEAKTDNIDTDFAYFNFKRDPAEEVKTDETSHHKREAAESQNQDVKPRQPWDAELDFANYEF